MRPFIDFFWHNRDQLFNRIIAFKSTYIWCHQTTCTLVSCCILKYIWPTPLFLKVPSQKPGIFSSTLPLFKISFDNQASYGKRGEGNQYAGQSDSDLLRLTRSEFGWSSGGIAALKVFQNERLLEFEFKKSIFFVMYYVSFQIINWNAFLFNETVGFFVYHYLWNNILAKGSKGVFSSMYYTKFQVISNY